MGLATVTPLASIFGSGFLIIIPILERELGALAVVGMAVVCLVAWMVGIAIRHNVAVGEPLADAGCLDPTTSRIDRASDLVIVLAYVISVALYLRILALFVVGYVSSGSGASERLLAVILVGLITAVGLVRGLAGLELLERLALGSVLVLVLAIGATFAGNDASQLLGAGLRLPPVPGSGLVSVLLVLGGIVITVQGFETVRYLQHIDRRARIAGCRLSQAISSIVYILIVALATPLMGLGTRSGADRGLLELVQRVAPLLALPLVLCAVFSQFSAATADTEAGVGNLRVIGWAPLRGRRRYLLVGGVAAVLAGTLGTSVIIVVASRAFAAYYALQCTVALRTSNRKSTRVAYGILALLMVAITLLARPAQ
ncbi:MAG: hypothetical protein ABI355_15335 [Solirubrobacteraceae bacterium]